MHAIQDTSTLTANAIHRKSVAAKVQRNAPSPSTHEAATMTRDHGSDGAPIYRHSILHQRRRQPGLALEPAPRLGPEHFDLALVAGIGQGRFEHVVIGSNTPPHEPVAALSRRRPRFRRADQAIAI